MMNKEISTKIYIFINKKENKEIFVVIEIKLKEKTHFEHYFKMK